MCVCVCATNMCGVHVPVCVTCVCGSTYRYVCHTVYQCVAVCVCLSHVLDPCVTLQAQQALQLAARGSSCAHWPRISGHHDRRGEQTGGNPGSAGQSAYLNSVFHGLPVLIRVILPWLSTPLTIFPRVEERKMFVWSRCFFCHRS